MVTMVEEKLYTVPEVAAQFRVHPNTVLNWLRSGKMAGYRLGGTKAGWRIRESDIRAFLAASKIEPSEPDSGG